MYTPKSCLMCGKVFTDPKHPNRKYCSHECATESQKRRVNLTCLHCGQEFIVPQKLSNRKFCSPACSNRYNQKPDPSKRAIFTCQWCNQPFEEWAYRKPRFCSNQCRSEYAARQPKPSARKPEIHVTLTCVICGSAYKTTVYQVKLRGSSCCSRECVAILVSTRMTGNGNHNYRGGTVKYRGTNWGKQSRAALKRDGYRCQICKTRLGRKPWDYGIHHIKPYREFNGDYESANQLLNLVTLCRSCHGRVEAGKLSCPRPLL